MGKNHILLLICKNTCLFCNGYCSFLCITGNHNYLDSCIIENLNSLNRICSDIITQTQNCHKNSLSIADFRYREKLHGSLCLCMHLFFYFIFICLCKLSFFPVRKHVMCYFINDILCSTLPVNKSVFQFYSGAFLLGIKTADLFYLIGIIIRVIISVLDCIGKQGSVHVVASNCFSFRGDLCKIIQCDCFDKFFVLIRRNDSSISCDQFYQ